MRMPAVRSMIVPALLIAILAPVARGQDTTATAPPPAPAPRSPDSTAAPPPALPPVAPAVAPEVVPPPAPTPAPGAAPTAAQAVALDSVPEGRALLYLFNGSGRSLLGGKYGVKCDGKKIAELPRTTYSVVALDPGKHKLQTSSGGGKLDLTAEAGKRYFVLLAYWPDRSWATTPEDRPLFFEQVEEDRARTFISRTRRNEAPAK